MGGGSLTIIGRRTANVSYLHEFSALWNTKLVPPTANGFACIAVFGPALRLLTCSTFTLLVSVHRLRFFGICKRVVPHPTPTCGLQAHRGTGLPGYDGKRSHPARARCGRPVKNNSKSL